jgi:hypothetical protein
MNSTVGHLLHAVAIAAVSFIIMKYTLNQSCDTATTRSLVIGAVVLIYMILFGHGLPTRMPRI